MQQSNAFLAYDGYPVAISRSNHSSITSTIRAIDDSNKLVFVRNEITEAENWFEMLFPGMLLFGIPVFTIGATPLQNINRPIRKEQEKLASNLAKEYQKVLSSTTAFPRLQIGNGMVERRLFLLDAFAENLYSLALYIYLTVASVSRFPMTILLLGRASTGKTTLSKYLSKYFGLERHTIVNDICKISSNNNLTILDPPGYPFAYSSHLKMISSITKANYDRNRISSARGWYMDGYGGKNGIFQRTLRKSGNIFCVLLDSSSDSYSSLLELLPNPTIIPPMSLVDKQLKVRFFSVISDMAYEHRYIHCLIDTNVLDYTSRSNDMDLSILEQPEFAVPLARYDSVPSEIRGRKVITRIPRLYPEDVLFVLNENKLHAISVSTLLQELELGHVCSVPFYADIQLVFSPKDQLLYYHRYTHPRILVSGNLQGMSHSTIEQDVEAIAIDDATTHTSKTQVMDTGNSFLSAMQLFLYLLMVNPKGNRVGMDSTALSSELRPTSQAPSLSDFLARMIGVFGNEKYDDRFATVLAYIWLHDSQSEHWAYNYLLSHCSDRLLLFHEYRTHDDPANLVTSQGGILANDPFNRFLSVYRMQEDGNGLAKVPQNSSPVKIRDSSSILVLRDDPREISFVPRFLHEKRAQKTMETGDLYGRILALSRNATTSVYNGTCVLIHGLPVVFLHRDQVRDKFLRTLLSQEQLYISFQNPDTVLRTKHQLNLFVLSKYRMPPLCFHSIGRFHRLIRRLQLNMESYKEFYVDKHAYYIRNPEPLYTPVTITDMG